MQKFIHNAALLASVIALTCGLWQDWGVWLTVKRMFISYLGFFTCGSCLFLVFRAVPGGEVESRGTEGNQAVGKGARG